MKSKLVYLMIVALAAFTLTGCDDESTAGLTRITYYADLKLDGGSTVIVDKGSTFTDPGYTATLNGEDVTADVTVTSNVDTSRSGVYSVSYSIVNEDGFASTASRTVIVLDANDPVEGFYDTDPNSYRISGGSTVAYGASYSILIIGNGDGTYYVDDLLAGWYCQRAGYGTSYACQGNIAVAADGTVSLIDSYVPGWGDALSYMENGKFDAATGTLSYMVDYVGMAFYITMTK